MFDLKKAFDKVDHEILLNKLQFYGIRGTNNKLIRSYLSEHRQYAFVNESGSSLSKVEYGVPQGSVLGPLLFLISMTSLTILLVYQDFLQMTCV